MDEMQALYSRETEKSALGCMFLSQEAAELGRNTLTAADFYIPAYRAIFEAMQAVEAVDVVTVTGELQRRGEGERVPLSMLGEIATSVASSIHMRAYAEQLGRLSFYRRTRARANELAKAALAQDESEISRITERQRADSWGGEGTKTLAGGFTRRLERLARIRESGRSLIGLSTGFADLDAALGGLRDGDLIVLAGRPSMGKSALALDIARNARKTMQEKGDCVGIFSMEMSDEALGQRAYTAEYLIENDRFSIGGNDADWAAMLGEIERNAAGFERLMDGLLIDERSGMSIERMRGQCHAWRAKGFRLRLIVVDYLQLIAGKGENRTREIGEISRGLKRLAKDFDCPVLALSQLSRRCEERADKRPALSDLRESGDIEQDADVVLLLWREEYYFPGCEEGKRGVSEVNIAKQREGPTGTIRLRWFSRSTTFRDLEKFHRTDAALPQEWRG